MKNPILEEQSTNDYNNVPGNYYDKYATGNLIARALMNGFLSSFDELVATSNAKTAYEVGCGEGHLSVRMMEQGLTVRGSDLEPLIIAQAQKLAKSRRVDPNFQVADMYKLTRQDVSADLLVCCEVMEHLPDSEKALSVLADLANPYLIVSVPREPIWRVLNMMRGKYIGALGNTPGHIQHWSKDQFINFINKRFEVLEIRSPLPWTMLFCRVRS